MAEKEIMTAAELAEYLSFSKNWVYRKAEEGEIPGMRMGNRWRFKRSLINEWIEGRAPGEGRRPRGRARRLEGRLAEGLGFIRSKREITTKDYAKKFKVCEATARKDLKELIRQNLVRKIGGGPNIRYVAK
ncbi:MAG: helix-turn-helix domain-containing protein [Candidatus Bipolaricaulia bacterium]